MKCKIQEEIRIGLHLYLEKYNRLNEEKRILSDLSQIIQANEQPIKD